jgi:hypothetical protein
MLAVLVTQQYYPAAAEPYEILTLGGGRDRSQSSVAGCREHASRDRARGLVGQHQDHEPGLDYVLA